MDIKSNLRHSDEILLKYNKFLIGKQTGGISDTEYSDILINIGDLFANQIKQGKVSADVIDSYKSFIDQFVGENKDNYFDFPHKGLDYAGKTNFESIEFAKEVLVEKRNMYEQPSMKMEQRDSYSLGFRKLGN